MSTIASAGMAQNQPISQRKTRVETDANGSRMLVDAETGRAIYWLPNEPTAEESAEAQRLLARTFPQTISPETWDAAQEEIARLSAEIATLERDKAQAYTERNACVAVMVKMALALGFDAGVKRTAIEGWDEEWNNCAWIDFPNGQASWHYHDSDAHLFAGLPEYHKAWDGHTTEQKYQMLAALCFKNPAEPLYLPQPGAEGALGGECIGGEGEGG